jgi:hypothetical protein
MSQRYPGNIVRATPLTPTGPAQNGAASGVWTLDQAQYWLRQGLWPIAGRLADGTFGIFALACNNNCWTTAREKYTYSSCSNSAATAATAQTNLGGSAAGNSTVGIFALGLDARNKYVYATNVVSAGGSATQTTPFGGGSATGNSTTGIFALGVDVYYCCCGYSNPVFLTTRNKYTYSNDVVASAASSSPGSGFGAAAGNSTVGIFAIGACSGSDINFSVNRTSTRNKYTYSGDTNASATSATAASMRMSAAGNSTTGIFALGGTCYNTGLVTRNKYTYSGDVNASATAATAASFSGAATGNSTRGIFALGGTPGASTTRNRYTYSGDVVAAGTASVIPSKQGSAASNGITGVTV